MPVSGAASPEGSAGVASRRAAVDVSPTQALVQFRPPHAANGVTVSAVGRVLDGGDLGLCGGHFSVSWRSWRRIAGRDGVGT
jgi:hypothetical protein